MKKILCSVAVSIALLTYKVRAQTPIYQVHITSNSPSRVRTLAGSDFRAAGEALGWSLEVNLAKTAFSPDKSLLRITNEQHRAWLEARVEGTGKAEQIKFLLYTDYKSDPLTTAIPLHPLSTSMPRHVLLRYQPFRLSLFVDGVLVDEEWPVGTIPIGSSPRLQTSASVTQISIWNSALTDGAIALRNGGEKQVSAKADEILGPEPREVQYSRPRGWDTNAGDAMPFYHDGTFHLFFLFDRRQHHSKWGLGAHQWAHISSTDLVHWKRYPIALPIEHEWEGSICTGSVFFHDGLYYAHYATRLPDHSERLGVALSRDGVHFTKTMPSPFAEPAPPFLHGPNRDPFVFQEGDNFHMLVTAAIKNSALPDGEEGALEHLISKDLSTWSVLPQPSFLSGSDAQPECSDLFHWGNWYYLLFGLSGTTHYRISQSSTGPWRKPPSDILDGPEAKVMKEAEFNNDRRVMVGFLQHDGHYGGDLVFRELIQQKDGSLGTKSPKEMEPSTKSTRKLADMHLGPVQNVNGSILLRGNARIAATVASRAGSTFAIQMGSTEKERLVFDEAAGTVTWVDATGKSTRSKLDNVSNLADPVALVLTFHDSIVDLSLNGSRTLIHRLSSSQPQTISFSSEGAIDVTHLTVSATR